MWNRWRLFVFLRPDDFFFWSKWLVVYLCLILDALNSLGEPYGLWPLRGEEKLSMLYACLTLVRTSNYNHASPLGLPQHTGIFIECFSLSFSVSSLRYHTSSQCSIGIHSGWWGFRMEGVGCWSHWVRRLQPKQEVFIWYSYRVYCLTARNTKIYTG